MIKEITYPNAGLLDKGQTSIDRALVGGRNGLSYCTGVRISQYSGFVLIRPQTTRGDKANTFIHVPDDIDTLRAFARCFEALARARSMEKDELDPLIQRYRAAAQARAREGELEVDDNAVVSPGEDPGAYVESWMWVPWEDLDDEAIV